jgi:hypothetical protein
MDEGRLCRRATSQSAYPESLPEAWVATDAGFKAPIALICPAMIGHAGIEFLPTYAQLTFVDKAAAAAEQQQQQKQFNYC